MHLLLEVVSWMRWSNWMQPWRSDSTNHTFNLTEITIRLANAQIDQLIWEKSLVIVWNSTLFSNNDMHEWCNREDELRKLTHVKLDREHLTCLPPHLFLLLPNLTNLYLQQVQASILSLSMHWTLCSIVSRVWSLFVPKSFTWKIHDYYLNEILLVCERLGGAFDAHL